MIAWKVVSFHGVRSPELIEAELFGYLPGAFTGAERERRGLLESADGGTVLFDEVGELPSTVQAKLLRSIDEGRVRPLGAESERPFDVRFLFATHCSLDDLVARGSFRADLLHRMKVFEIIVPPIRDRLENLGLLVEHFLPTLSSGVPRQVGDGVLRVLAEYSWPGKIRELRNFVSRILLTGSGPITADDVRAVLNTEGDGPVFSPEVFEGRSLEGLQIELEREYIEAISDRCGGDLTAIADALGIKVRALYARLKKLGLQPGDLRRMS